jgi:hypothetical protein
MGGRFRSHAVGSGYPVARTALERIDRGAPFQGLKPRLVLRRLCRRLERGEGKVGRTDPYTCRAAQGSGTGRGTKAGAEAQFKRDALSLDSRPAPPAEAGGYSQKPGGAGLLPRA